MTFEIKHPCSPDDAKYYDTERIRKEFVIEKMFIDDEINFTYSHFDRIITGGAMPVKNILKLIDGEVLHSTYFLERRELGVINIAGNGIVDVDGVKYQMAYRDCLYVGMGAKNVSFESVDPKNPAKYYMNSSPAHKTYPTVLIPASEAIATNMGSVEESNKRIIYKYFHENGIKSCQLIMGMTLLESGSVWNTMPCHTHERRMEVYLYFNMQPDSLVFHLIGKADETRHIVIRNEQAVISPSWSIHSGCGTKNYTFIWGMCGENQTFDDMDAVNMNEIR